MCPWLHTQLLHHFDCADSILCDPLHALIHLKCKVLSTEVCGLGNTSCLCCLVVLHSVPFSKPFAGFLCPCQENAEEKETPNSFFSLAFKICFCRFRYVFTCLVFSPFDSRLSPRPISPCVFFFWHEINIAELKPSLPEVSIHGSKKPLRLEWHKLKRPFSFYPFTMSAAMIIFPQHMLQKYFIDSITILSNCSQGNGPCSW